MLRAKPRPVSMADQAAVLTKATLRAATQLGLTNKLLATVIGVSEATVSRMRSGDYALQRGQQVVRTRGSLRAPLSFARCDRGRRRCGCGHMAQEPKHHARWRATRPNPDRFRADERHPISGRPPRCRLTHARLPAR